MVARGVIVGLGAVVVLTGAGIGFVLWQEGQQREDSIQSLVDAAAIELGRDEIDRGGIADLLRKMRQHEEAESEPRLIRTRAELEFRRGRLQNAWEIHRALALAMDPAAEDLALASRVLFRWFGISGDTKHLERAFDFAKRHHDKTRDVGSLFLAWQCACRVGDNEQRDELAAELKDQHGQTREGKLVAALGTAGVSRQTLLDLEIEFDDVPAELDLAIAVQDLAAESGATVTSILRRVERVLEAFPADADVRNVAAVAYHQAGNQASRDSHLHWLLSNAPADDNRRPGWQQMLETQVR